MAIVERFEDLIACQKARELNRKVYDISRVGKFAKDYSLSNQIQRASISVMGNIAEGFERCGDAEFPHFLSHAKGSCGEVWSHLYAALDVGYVGETESEKIRLLAEDVSKIISKLRLSVQSSRRDNKG